MKCVLMNKNVEILTAEYNTILKGFDKIYEINNMEYAPIILYNLYLTDNSHNKLLEQLTKWFQGRGIPSWRDDLDLLLSKLNISTPTELLDKAFGLSLSDQYWVKPYDSKVEYKDINFFEHDFEDLLHKYQDITRMTDRRINKICTLLFSRINKLKRIIENIYDSC